MFKSGLILVLVALWGLGDARNIAEADEGDISINSISTNVNDLRYLHFVTPDQYNEIDFNNRNSFQAAGIRFDQPVTIIIDGFLSNSTSPMTTLLKGTYVQAHHSNVIVLDWSKLSGSKANVGNPISMAAAYIKVLGNVGPIGQRLGEFMELLVETRGVSLRDMTVVGGSLGAHIAGACGSKLRQKYGSPQVGRIVGLDPAGPFFSMQVDPDKRLHKGDALSVEVYHSNRGNLGDSEHDTGDINVYLNGGDNQPGCAQADKDNSGLCSHNYSFKAFNLAFNGNVKACPCSGNSQCTSQTPITCANPLTLGPSVVQGHSGRYHATLGEI